MHADAEEDLGDVFELVLAVPNGAIPDDGWIGAGFPRGGEEVAGDLVVRAVAVDGIAKPLVEGDGSAGVFGFGAFVAKNGGPLSGEVVGVIGRGEELLDFPRPFVGGVVGEEGIGLVDTGKSSGDVDGDASEEGGIIAVFGRRQAEGLELGKDVLVDEVGRRRKIFDGCTEGEDGAEDVDVFLEAYHDGSGAGSVAHGHVAGHADVGAFFIVGFILREVGDVACCVVREMGGDAKLLFCVRLGQTFLGVN